MIHKRPVLIIGVGNPDRGDDGAGPAVARRLEGWASLDISVLERDGDVLTMIADWEVFSSVIVVDAAAPIHEPGRVDRLDLTNDQLLLGLSPRSSHAFGLAETIELARSLRKLPPSIIAYLIEGEQFETGAPLSAAVGKAVDNVAEEIVKELCAKCG